MIHAHRPLALILLGVALAHCSSTSSPAASNDADGGACYPDNDGINGGSYTIDLVVNDTGFFASGGDDAGAAVAKNIIATQNDAQVTLTLTNSGHEAPRLHGRVHQRRSRVPEPSPRDAPRRHASPRTRPSPRSPPGTSATITFDTPTPDGLLYPFTSSEPSDSTVPGLNNGQWSLM